MIAVRAQIVGFAVLAAAVAVVLFGFPLAVTAAHYAQLYKVLDLERQAEKAASRVAADMSVGAGPDPDELHDDGELTFLSVYDTDGKWLLGRGPSQPDEFVLEAAGGRVQTGVDGGDLVAAAPVTHDGNVVGVVRVSGSRSTLLWPLVVAWAGMAALALASVGGVWLLARRQVVRLTRPLDDLSEAARRVGDGDFSVRLPGGRYPEIDAVGSSLNRTAVRLDHLVTRERTFSAEASHQLRTPLTGLRLALEAALEPGGDVRGGIASGIGSADRIERTIEELLGLARDTHRARQAFDVCGLIEELVAERNAQLSREKRAVKVVALPGTPRVQASMAVVRQILTVLLDNAVTYGEGEIEVRAREADTAVAIDVSDEGPGVHVPLTDLFVDRPSAAATGHRLGLALARRLAAAEGGDLRLVRPHPPQFTLLLRAEPAP